MTSQREASDVAAIGSTPDTLRHSWCSDCGADTPFERVVAVDHASGMREWACTECGAAYLDFIDVVTEVAVTHRSVA